MSSKKMHLLFMHFKIHEKVLKEFFSSLNINIKKMRVSNKWAYAQIKCNRVVAYQRHGSMYFKSLENGNYVGKAH